MGAYLYGGDGPGASVPVQPLIRFVNGEGAYLANANGGPRMFFNMEDHTSHSTGQEATKLQVLPHPYADVDASPRCASVDLASVSQGERDAALFSELRVRLCLSALQDSLAVLCAEQGGVRQKQVLTNRMMDGGEWM